MSTPPFETDRTLRWERNAAVAVAAMRASQGDESIEVTKRIAELEHLLSGAYCAMKMAKRAIFDGMKWHPTLERLYNEALPKP